MLTHLSSWPLVLVVAAITFGMAALGIAAGRWLREHRDGLKEPLGTLQAALIGFVALLLAFGLSMAVGRYEARRAAVVEEANAIGTAYLRAQVIPEPMRSESLDLLRSYTDARIDLGHTVPGSDAFDRVEARTERLQNELWRVAGEALERQPTQTATRLYVETLNETIDQDTSRVAALENRIPDTVLWLQLMATALAVGVLAVYLAAHDRGLTMALVAAGLVTIIVLAIFDLDRPHRGTITVPDQVLVGLRRSMDEPPAANGPP